MKMTRDSIESRKVKISNGMDFCHSREIHKTNLGENNGYCYKSRTRYTKICF